MQTIYNKQARHSYEILGKFQVGLVLTGQEAKAIKSGQISLKSAYITIMRSPEPELFLVKASVSPYKFCGQPANYNPERPRKLLIKKAGLRTLIGKLEQKGLTLVPLSVYTNRNFVKMEIGLARGKKLYEKKEQLKQRDVEREIRRTLKNRK